MTPLHEILSRPPREAFPAFMQAWLGRPRGVSSVREPLPRSLRRIHAAYAGVPAEFDCNHLLLPGETKREDGYTIFYAENQWVWVWAIADDDRDAEDPPVWSREYAPGAGWAVETADVSTFLVQMAVMGAALGGRPHGAGAGWLAAADAELVLSPLTKLALPPWRWPGDPVRWYAGDDTVAVTCSNTYPGDADGSHVSLWISALTEEAVRFVEPHLSDAWDYYSPQTEA